MTDCDTKFSDGISSRPCAPRTHSHQQLAAALQNTRFQGLRCTQLVSADPDMPVVRTAKQSSSCLRPGPAATIEPLPSAPGTQEVLRTALCTSSSKGAVDTCPEEYEQLPDWTRTHHQPEHTPLPMRCLPTRQQSTTSSGILVELAGVRNKERAAARLPLPVLLLLYDVCDLGIYLREGRVQKLRPLRQAARRSARSMLRKIKWQSRRSALLDKA